MLRIAGLVVALLLAGCGQSYVYMRADGQDFAADPALYKQFETDSMICTGEAHRGGGTPTGQGYHAGAGSAAAKECMAAKGYLVVQSDFVDLKRQELAAKAVGVPEAAAAPGGAMEKLKSSSGGAAVSRTAPGSAADARPILEQCSRISDKAARLACFDRATARSSDSRR